MRRSAGGAVRVPFAGNVASRNASMGVRTSPAASRAGAGSVSGSKAQWRGLPGTGEVVAGRSRATAGSVAETRSRTCANRPSRPRRGLECGAPAPLSAGEWPLDVGIPAGAWQAAGLPAGASDRRVSQGEIAEAALGGSVRGGVEARRVTRAWDLVDEPQGCPSCAMRQRRVLSTHVPPASQGGPVVKSAEGTPRRA